MRTTRTRHKEPNDLTPSPFFEKESQAGFFEKTSRPFFATGGVVQRKDDKKDKAKDKDKDKVKDKAKAPPAGAAKKLTAADMPKLVPSMKDKPCACLVLVHNEEKNINLTGELMHQHCAYNLAMVKKGDRARTFKFPGDSKETDPNELFEPTIAEQCRADEKSCRDYITSNEKTEDADTMKKVTKMQFFLSMSDCSNKFTLPVVALHNNDIKDTQSYRDNIPAGGVNDLKMDIDKTKGAATDTKVVPKAEENPDVKKMKDLLTGKFNKETKDQLTGRAGTTNIFRWCASNDLSHCHIGDPAHPDNVTWVTNEEDYKALSKMDINVVWQSQRPAKKPGAAASESETDLSTLFITLKDLIGAGYTKQIAALVAGKAVDAAEIAAIQAKLAAASATGGMTEVELVKTYLELNLKQWALLNKNADISALQGKEKAELAKLRFLNIESPIKQGGPDSERVRNYEVIVQILKARGLHCCADPAKAEANVKEGLKTDAKAADKKDKK